MKNLQTIILAAGKGVRMKSDTPKVLHAVCGKQVIRYVLDIVRSLGSVKTYVVLGHKYDIVKKNIGSDAIAVRQQKMLGTADAIKVTKRYFQKYTGDVLVLSGDTPLLSETTIRKLIQKHRKTKASCTFLTAFVDDARGYGRVIRGQGNHAVAIREEKDASGQEKSINEINVGAYCFKAKALFGALGAIKLNEKKKEYYLTDIIALLHKRQARIETIQTSDSREGFGINTRQDLAQAQNIIRYRILDRLMSEGVTIVDPLTTYVDVNVRIGRDTIIKPHTAIETNVRIGEKCIIGPFCHIRTDVKIGDRVEVGNFAEVSRTMIGNDCFVKHFSFLGDSIIGHRVNVGAGVVTANFDGKHKNTTVVCDDSFIGSDSILIAPLKIGKKTITGAGAVVTRGKKIPDGSVVVGVPARIVSRGERT